MRLMPGVWSNLKAMAHTPPYDIAVMGDTQQGKALTAEVWSSYDIAVMGDTQQGKALTAEVWSSATAPTLVMTGPKSPDGFQSAARAVTEALPDADHHTLQGLNHGAVVMAPKKLAPKLMEFLQG